ncbi:MAG TPA: PA14 domain-containing protein [Bryobacteraceae bacterium]|nr:PA14 domain-containing protein [Bryobacteraceae bacterium]
MRRVLLLLGLLVGTAWAMQEPQQQDQEPVYVFGTSVVIPAGLQGAIYYISHSAPTIEDLEKKKPRGTIYTSSLNIPPQDYKLGFPGISKRLEWFAIDYRGKFWIQKAGDYKFELTADDGAMLYVDGQLVVDNSGLHPPVTLHGAAGLREGIHTIRVVYFQGIKYQVALVLKIAPPGQEYRIFSTNEFKPPATWTGPDDTAK